MTRKEQILQYLCSLVYPTTQIVTGETSVEEYVISIAKQMADEIFDRRMPVNSLPFWAELGMILHEEEAANWQAGSPTTVVNIRTDAYDVLIDRRTKWGNPFKGERNWACDEHNKWIRQPEQAHLIASLHELKGKRLGCWCKPQRCHGDNLVALIQELGI